MRGTVLLVAALVSLMPPASAQVPEVVQPPTDLQGDYNETSKEIHLTWQEPTDDVDYAYTVYRNGKVLDTTHATNYTDHLNISLANLGMTTYYVTATPMEGEYAGQESAPSSPLLAWDGPVDGPCNPLFIGVYPGPPFVAYTIRWECIPLPFVGRSVVLLEPGDFMELWGW